MKTDSKEGVESPKSRKKLGRECLVIALWLGIITKIFIFDFDLFLARTLAPDLEVVLTHKYLITLFVFAWAPLFLKRKSLRRLALYFLCYPVILVTRLLKSAAKRWSELLLASPFIIEYYKTHPPSWALFMMTLLAVLALLQFSNPGVLIVSVVIVAFSFLRYLGHSIRAAWSTTVFEHMADAVADFKREFMAGISEDGRFFRVKVGGSSVGAAVTKPAEHYGIYYVCITAAKWLHQKAKLLRRRRFADIYVFLSWLFVFTASVATFGISYLGLHKLDATMFDSNADWNIATSIEFSFYTQILVGSSSIVPTGLASQILVFAQSFISFILIGGFLFALFGTLRQAYLEEIEDIIDDCQAIAVRARAELDKLYNSNRISTIEQDLAKGGYVKMINGYRDDIGFLR